VPTEQFQTCETGVRKLTEPLGCTELRVNRVRLEPGEVTTPHAHEDQEEVFVALTEGQIAIEGTVRDASAGGVVRVAPGVTRDLLDRTDEEHAWLGFGAPPVGTVDGFGAYVVTDED
jgi:quercetin dioxygenase-like cupin family protein